MRCHCARAAQARKHTQTSVPCLQVSLPRVCLHRTITSTLCPTCQSHQSLLSCSLLHVLLLRLCPHFCLPPAPLSLPKGSHWPLSHGTSRNGRIRSYQAERETHLSLCQWPAVRGSNAFSYTCRLRRLRVCCSCMRLALPMRSFASRCVCCLPP